MLGESLEHCLGAFVWAESGMALKIRDVDELSFSSRKWVQRKWCLCIYNEKENPSKEERNSCNQTRMNLFKSKVLIRKGVFFFFFLILWGLFLKYTEECKDLRNIQKFVMEGWWRLCKFFSKTNWLALLLYRRVSDNVRDTVTWCLGC